MPIILVLGVSWGLFSLLSGTSEEVARLGSPKAPSAIPPNPFEDSNDWAGKLKTRAEVSFVREAEEVDDPREEILELKGLGPLTGQDLVFAKEIAASLYQARTSELASFQSSMRLHDLRDAHTEAVMLKEVEVALAVGQLLESGGYQVLPSGQNLPLAPGERLTFGVLHKGQQATAVFDFDSKSFPRIGAMRAYERGVREAWIKQLVNTFNIRPLGERQSLLEKQQRLSGIPANTRAPQDHDFLLEQFPIGVAINYQSSTLSAVSVQ